MMLNWLGRELRFEDPPMLLLLLALLAIALYSARPRMRFSAVGLAAHPGRGLRSRVLWLPPLLLYLAAALIVVALARPQSAWRDRKHFSEGIAIMLVLDVSDSMRAMDFTPNRLTKSKQVVKQFIDDRIDDAIGVTIFGHDTFTMCPLTHDYAALKGFIDRIDFDLVNGEGTAIGMGLMNALSHLRNYEVKSKVAVLLTDGENNAGVVDPITAASSCKEFGVKVYTIGVGSTSSRVPYPAALGPRSIRSSLDVEQLTSMAELTGGQFFRATDDRSLEKIYRDIDQLERSRVEVTDTQYWDDLAHFLMLPALALLALAFLMENTWLRTYP